MHFLPYAALITALLGASSTEGAVIERAPVELKPIKPGSIPGKLSPRGDTDDGPTMLLPINADDFGAVMGLKVRDVVDFSRLDLAKQAELIFGAPGDQGNMLLANMTLYAPGGQLIIMMESFEGLTSSVDCKGDDGEMALTFKSQEAFEYALGQWDFINEKTEYAFLMIANHDGCGPDEQRQAYKYALSGADGCVY
jgi:hypothetical protein